MTDAQAKFVVKAEHGPLGQPLWLSTRWPDGRRDFVPAKWPPSSIHSTVRAPRSLMFIQCFAKRKPGSSLPFTRSTDGLPLLCQVHNSVALSSTIPSAVLSPVGAESSCHQRELVGRGALAFHRSPQRGRHIPGAVRRMNPW